MASREHPRPNSRVERRGGGCVNFPPPGGVERPLVKPRTPTGHLAQSPPFQRRNLSHPARVAGSQEVPPIPEDSFCGPEQEGSQQECLARPQNACPLHASPSPGTRWAPPPTPSPSPAGHRPDSSCSRSAALKRARDRVL